MVKDYLLIKENDKRILEVSPEDDVDGKNKKLVVQVSESDMKMKANKNIIKEVMDFQTIDDTHSACNKVDVEILNMAVVEN